MNDNTTTVLRVMSENNREKGLLGVAASPGLAFTYDPIALAEFVSYDERDDDRTPEFWDDGAEASFKAVLLGALREAGIIGDGWTAGEMSYVSMAAVARHGKGARYVDPDDGDGLVPLVDEVESFEVVSPESESFWLYLANPYSEKCPTEPVGDGPLAWPLTAQVYGEKPDC